MSSFLELWQQNAPKEDFKPFGLFPKQNFELPHQILVDEIEVHDDFVGGLVVNHKHFFTSSEDATFKVWDKETLHLIQEIETCPTNQIKISPCGLYVATADDDCQVKVYHYNIENEEEPLKLHKTLTGHDDYVSRLAFTENLLISGSKDGLVKVWNYEKGKLLKDLEGHEEWVYALGVSPDHKKLLSGALNSTLKYWNLEDYSLINDILEGSSLHYVMGMTIGGGNHSGKGNKNAVHEIAWIDENHVITMANDIVLWNVNTWEIIWQVDSGNKYDIKSSIFIPKYNLLVTACEVIEGWDVKTGKQIFLEVGHGGSDIYSCAYNENLYTADENGTLKIWNIEALMASGIKREHSDSVGELYYHQEQKTLLSSAYDDTILVWNEEMTAIEKLRKKDGSQANFLATVPKKPHLSVWGWQGQVIVFDAKKKKITKKIAIKNELVQYEKGVFINDDEILCMTLCYLSRIINIKTKEMTMLEIPAPFNKSIQHTENQILAKTYPTKHLDRKDELPKKYKWKNLLSKEDTKKHKQKESPVYLFNLKNLEIEKTFEVPKHLKFKENDTKYAMETLHLRDNLYFFFYSDLDYTVILWDIENQKALHEFKNGEKENTAILYRFIHQKCLYQVDKTGNLRCFDAENYTKKEEVFLQDNLFGVSINFFEEKKILFFANQQGEFWGMNIDTKEIILKGNIKIKIRCALLKNNQLFVGTENGKVFAFELFKV